MSDLFVTVTLAIFVGAVVFVAFLLRYLFAEVE